MHQKKENPSKVHQKCIKKGKSIKSASKVHQKCLKKENASKVHQKCIKSASKKENASFTNISRILLTLVNFTNISKILRKIRLVKPVILRKNLAK